LHPFNGHTFKAKAVRFLAGGFGYLASGLAFASAQYLATTKAPA
jgi:hypothetical protein